MDKQPLQLFHSARRKGNYSQQLEGYIYHRSLKKGKQGLDPLDPFASIDPLSDESEPIDFAVQSNEEVDHSFASAYQHDDEDGDGEWLDENEEPIQNIFELVNDM